jgi:hypothetical protein
VPILVLLRRVAIRISLAYERTTSDMPMIAPSISNMNLR